MKMKLVNISRKQAEEFGWVVDHRDWMISISSSRSPDAKITAPFGKVFTFHFDDVLRDEEHAGKTWKAITNVQAEEIARIIFAAERSNVTTLWVHCDAGICRSGAIVEAAKLLGHSPDDEISNERIPNATVFTKVRLALGIRHSFEEVLTA